MRISDWSSDVCSSDLAKVAPPPHVAAAGMENLALDPAGPDADVIIHPLLTQHLRKAFGRRDQRVAAAIEPAQPGDAERFEKGEVIIAEIGFEARVDRTGERNMPPPRPGRGLPRHAVGAGDKEDVGGKFGERKSTSLKDRTY